MRKRKNEDQQAQKVAHTQIQVHIVCLSGLSLTYTRNRKLKKWKQGEAARTQECQVAHANASVYALSGLSLT